MHNPFQSKEFAGKPPPLSLSTAGLRTEKQIRFAPGIATVPEESS